MILLIITAFGVWAICSAFAKKEKYSSGRVTKYNPYTDKW